MFEVQESSNWFCSQAAYALSTLLPMNNSASAWPHRLFYSGRASPFLIPPRYCHSLPSLNVSWIKETFLHFTKWKKKSICNLGIPLCPTVRELMLGSSQRATIYIAHGEANPNLPCVLLHLTKNAL